MLVVVFLPQLSCHDTLNHSLSPNLVLFSFPHLKYAYWERRCKAVCVGVVRTSGPPRGSCDPLGFAWVAPRCCSPGGCQLCLCWRQTSQRSPGGFIVLVPMHFFFFWPVCFPVLKSLCPLPCPFTMRWLTFSPSTVP